MKDCDQDGIPDPVCEDSAGNVGFLQSSLACTTTWPIGNCLQNDDYTLPARPWCYTVDGPEWDYCDIEGTLEVRVSDEDDWDSAEPCTAHRTDAIGFHHAKIDPLSQSARFTCSGNSSSTYLFVGVIDEEQGCAACGDAEEESLPRPLRLCEVAITAEMAGVDEFLPIHGAFHYDPTQCASNGKATDEASRCDVTPWYWDRDIVGGKANAEEYSPLTSAAMTFIVAGNTTLFMESHECPRAGCYVPPPVARIASNPNEFNWSCVDCWNRTGDPAVDVPLGVTAIYSDFEIPEDWTVWLDVVTPVMYSLTIRGTLKFRSDMYEEIGLHAYNIDIRGGHLEVGTEDEPFMNGYGAFIEVHGDVKIHGRGEAGKGFCVECAKNINVNGYFSMHGRPRVPMRKLLQHAEAGAKMLYLDGPVDWMAGERVVITGLHDAMSPMKATVDVAGPTDWQTSPYPITDHKMGGVSRTAGMHEIRVVQRVLDGGATVQLTEAVSFFHIGENITEAGINMNVRDTVSLLDRNVELRAGATEQFDLLSGLSVRQQEYGFTVTAHPLANEPRQGYTVEDPDFLENGIRYLQPGEIHMKYIKWVTPGKQWAYSCGRDACFHQYPAVWFDASQAHPVMEGIVTEDPVSGKMFDHFESITLKDNTFFGAELKFGTSASHEGGDYHFNHGRQHTHSLVNNLILADQRCRLSCTENYVIEFFGDSKFVVTGNRVYYGYIAMLIAQPCYSVSEWNDNVMMGNRYGYWVYGCTSLALQAYRNGIGVSARTGIDEMSNMELVENGIGFVNNNHVWWPEIKTPLEWRWSKGSTNIVDSTIIGLSEMTASRADTCDIRLYGGPYSNGGLVSGYRSWGGDWDYAGIQVTGIGTMDDWVDGAKVEISNVKFRGFTGSDDCGRSNVAITNDIAGIGRGRQGSASTGNYGFAFCQPIFVKGLDFGSIPLNARLKFAWGAAGTQADDIDYGFSECIAYDLDRSLNISSPSWDRNETQLLISAAPRRWPATYQEACEETLANPLWWDTGDGLNAINRCPPWLRNEPELLAATRDYSRQGVVHTVAAYDGQSPDWGGRDAKASCTDVDDIGGMDCHGVDYIYMMNFVERRAVSGSEILYGPVGISTCTVPNGEPNLIMQDPEEFPHHVFTGGTGPWGCKNPKDGGTGSGSGRSGRCLVQPNTFFLANGGCYDMHYTGDIGLFERNEFTLLGASTVEPRFAIDEQEVPEWGVILKIRYLWPGKINVYYNEKFVPAVGRIDRLTIDQPAGSNYYHPISKDMTLVVKGGRLSDRVKLKLLQAVQVNLVIAETFDSFFLDNSIDPATLPDELVAQLPPNYVASYDPDNGNIVKSNRFVRNMASVLKINPERIRVTNIVPGNRRRLGEDGRVLVEDGLDIGFDVNEVDPCETVECANGECVAGMCECASGWYGELCDSDPCADDIAEPCLNGVCVPKGIDSKRCTCEDGWTGTLCDRAIVVGAPPTVAPTSLPTVSPSANPTMSPTATLNITDVEEEAEPFDALAELVNIAAILVEKAAAGTLDTGYTVTEMAITVPPDVCGVPGGDGTTCLDACDIANGDNSTCADLCGLPNGNDSTCLDACGVPNGDDACLYVTAVNSTTDDILRRYNSCVSASEVQRVRVVVDDMSGPIFFQLQWRNDRAAGPALCRRHRYFDWFGWFVIHRKCHGGWATSRQRGSYARSGRRDCWECHGDGVGLFGNLWSRGPTAEQGTAAFRQCRSRKCNYCRASTNYREPRMYWFLRRDRHHRGWLYIRRAGGQCAEQRRHTLCPRICGHYHTSHQCGCHCHGDASRPL